MAENETSGFGWFLAGLGIGALVGVLYAPKSGKETREDIVSGALDAKERAAVLAQRGAEAAGQYVEQGKQVAGQYVDQGKQAVGQVVDQGKQVAGEYVDKGREYYDKGRSQWTEYVEKGKSLVNEQQVKVAAAVDAGKDAYVNTTAQG